tara:strand:+ start:871 stop:1200 length:330 start_codon:yes stop_codon:yes gene_type:complete
MRFLLFVLLFVSIACSIALNQRETLADKISEGIVKMRDSRTHTAFAYTVAHGEWKPISVKQHIRTLRETRHLCEESSRFLSSASSMYDDNFINEKVNAELTSKAISLCE